LLPEKGEGIGWKCGRVGDASVIDEDIDLLRLKRERSGWSAGSREEV
jgi:hypothetical protein